MRSIPDIFTFKHERLLNLALDKIDVKLDRHVAVRVIAATYWGDTAANMSDMDAYAELHAVYVALNGLHRRYMIDLIAAVSAEGAEPANDRLKLFLEDVAREEFKVPYTNSWTALASRVVKETPMLPVINVYLDSAPDLAHPRTQAVVDYMRSGTNRYRFVHVDLTPVSPLAR